MFFYKRGDSLSRGSIPGMCFSDLCAQSGSGTECPPPPQSVSFGPNTSPPVLHAHSINHSLIYQRRS